MLLIDSFSSLDFCFLLRVYVKRKRYYYFLLLRLFADGLSAEILYAIFLDAITKESHINLIYLIVDTMAWNSCRGVLLRLMHCTLLKHSRFWPSPGSTIRHVYDYFTKKKKMQKYTYKTVVFGLLRTILGRKKSHVEYCIIFKNTHVLLRKYIF